MFSSELDKSVFFIVGLTMLFVAQSEGGSNFIFKNLFALD